LSIYVGNFITRQAPWVGQFLPQHRLPCKGIRTAANTIVNHDDSSGLAIFRYIASARSRCTA